jgi:FemAB-related protein (PEP-CTERM system-associated)
MASEPQVKLLNSPDRRIEVRRLEAGEEAEWDRFVRCSPSGTFFHLHAWQTVVERTLGHQSFRLVVRDERGITGVFPISWVRNRLFGDCLVSLPLAVYGGICADDEESYFSLLKAGNDLAKSLNVKYLEMRNLAEPFPTSLPTRDLYVTFLQDLAPGPDNLFRALPRDTRYMVRKTQKNGLVWDEELSLDDFYEIYARSVHRLGTPVFSKRLFEYFQSAFPKQYRIFGVRKGKDAIAGVFCFYFKDQVLPYYGASLAEFHKDSPNNFMYWSLIAQSCRDGVRWFDFGRSKRGSGSFTFKSSWSMQMIDLPYRYSLVRSTEVPHLSSADSVFSLPVRLWKQLPFPVAKALGPTVVKWIPSV